MSSPSRSMPPADAAARLRYVNGVRARARRALLLPSFAVPLGLGILLSAHAMVVALAPEGAVVTAAWIVGLIAARPLLRWRGHREGTVHATTWLLAVCVGSGVLAAVAATAAGVSPMLSCLAAATGTRAYLAGRPLIAILAVATGAVGDALLLSGASQPMVELVIGAALIVTGLAWSARAS